MLNMRYTSRYETTSHSMTYFTRTITENHSTATEILQLHDMWLQASDEREMSAVILLDQSAAYDLLCHKILKEKLELYNFGEDAVAWVMSYLEKRT